MGLFKKIGKGIKKAAQKVGKVVKAASPAIGAVASLIPGGGLVTTGLKIASKAIGTASKTIKKNPLGAIQGIQIPALGGIETVQTSSSKSNTISGNTSGSNSANIGGNSNDKSAKSMSTPVKLGLGYGLLKLLSIV